MKYLHTLIITLTLTLFSIFAISGCTQSNPSDTKEAVTDTVLLVSMLSNVKDDISEAKVLSAKYHLPDEQQAKLNSVLSFDSLISSVETVDKASVVEEFNKRYNDYLSLKDYIQANIGKVSNEDAIKINEFIFKFDEIFKRTYDVTVLIDANTVVDVPDYTSKIINVLKVAYVIKGML
jgi:hypothetical protein